MARTRAAFKLRNKEKEKILKTNIIIIVKCLFALIINK